MRTEATHNSSTLTQLHKRMQIVWNTVSMQSSFYFTIFINSWMPFPYHTKKETIL